MLLHMKQFLIEIDGRITTRLELVAEITSTVRSIPQEVRSAAGKDSSARRSPTSTTSRCPDGSPGRPDREPRERPSP
jgi:hypothetical protein